MCNLFPSPFLPSRSFPLHLCIWRVFCAFMTNFLCFFLFSHAMTRPFHHAFWMTTILFTSLFLGFSTVEDTMRLRPLCEVPSYSFPFFASHIMTQWILRRDHTLEFQRGVLSFLFTAFCCSIFICIHLSSITRCHECTTIPRLNATRCSSEIA